MEGRKNFSGKGRIGRREDIKVKKRLNEIEEIVGNDNRKMVGVKIKVENEIKIVIGLRRRGEDEKREEKRGKWNFINDINKEMWFKEKKGRVKEIN